MDNNLTEITPKRYFDLSTDQKLKLTSEQLYDAIRIEAINRGIKPPITLDAVLRQTEYRGFTTPPESVVVYEIVHTTSYSGVKETGVAFLNPEVARKATQGMVVIETDGYGNTLRKRIHEREFTIKETHITLLNPKNFNATVQEVIEDNAEFEKLCLECTTDLSTLRQAEYEKQIDLQRKKEYLNLAQGNIDIAKNFWAKTEKRAWPE